MEDTKNEVVCIPVKADMSRFKAMLLEIVAVIDKYDDGDEDSD